MWPAINSIVNSVFDAWLWPVRALPPLMQVCFIALPLTVFALLVFRYASNQAGISGAKNRIKAYLGYSLVPMAVMIVPVALVVIQIESRFAYRPVHPGESVIVTVTMQAATPVSKLDASLSPASAVAVETPALRLDDTAQILWRIRPDEPGAHALRLRTGAAEAKALVLAATPGAPIANAVYRANDWRTLVYPAGLPLSADSAVNSIEVGYPRARGAFLGLSSASWTLLAASLVMAYALRGWFGVTF
jgi:hypothetical protein